MDVFRVLLANEQVELLAVLPLTQQLPLVLAFRRLLVKVLVMLEWLVTMHNAFVTRLVVLVAHLPLVSVVRFSVLRRHVLVATESIAV
jgi:hypothetical protein